MREETKTLLYYGGTRFCFYCNIEAQRTNKQMNCIWNAKFRVLLFCKVVVVGCFIIIIRIINKFSQATSKHTHTHTHKYKLNIIYNNNNNNNNRHNREHQ